MSSAQGSAALSGLDTIEAGGNGYCLHATMRQAPRTAALFGRLQALVRRNQWDEAPTRDVVHFDMNPANILHAGGRLSGVVDWNIPFDGAGQGDGGFDVATLLFHTDDIEQTWEVLWGRALELSGLGWTAVYLCHFSLRQVEWSRRHAPDSADYARFTAIAEAVLDDCEARGVWRVVRRLMPLLSRSHRHAYDSRQLRTCGHLNRPLPRESLACGNAGSCLRGRCTFRLARFRL